MSQFETPLVHIEYPFVQGAWGGGNQFLKALRDRFEALSRRSPSIEEADVVLVNGNPGTAISQIRFLFTILKKKPSAITVVRLDGPITLIRNDDGQADAYLYALIREVADGVIFQSQWSKDRNENLGLKPEAFETVIGNAPDSTLFFPKEQRESEKRIRCIATSWSANMAKGFDIYTWLDEHLDFERYSFTFVGNSPVQFSRINHIPPLGSRELGETLREHDIYITASRCDPCSNSLIEALHCGLPAVFLKDGGHPEIAGKGGEGFTGPDDILQALERVASDIAGYRSKINAPSLNDAADAYVEFFDKILQARQSGYAPKRLGCLSLCKLLMRIILRVSKNRLRKFMG